MFSECKNLPNIEPLKSKWKVLDENYFDDMFD